MFVATLSPGVRVTLKDIERDALEYPPDADASLWIAVHPDALKAGSRNQLTQVVGLDPADEIVWVGALDEGMLATQDERRSGLRRRLADRVLQGAAQWSLRFVRSLTVGDPWAPHLTVYSGPRPWVVLGELSNGRLLAVPLNDAHGNPKWYTPIVRRQDIRFAGSAKDAQLELAHLWSIPADTRLLGEITPAVREDLAQDVWRYYSAGGAT
jgi:hypothetical protein